MDALAGLLRGPRAQGAFVLRSVMSPPWAMRIQDEAPLTVVAMVQGHVWIAFADGERALLQAGDVAVVRGPDPYLVADDPATTPQVVIHPGQRCTTLSGEDLAAANALGVRTWGNDAAGTAVMITGIYQAAGEVSRRLLTALPRLIVLAEGEWDCPIVPLLAGEVVKDDPGQEVVLDRLLDLLVIAVLRTWFARSAGGTPTWYRAQADPVVGVALRHLHADPARAWSVQDLAARAGVSRAALARRFHELVGEPPIAYLTGWRLALAADLLLEPDATVGAVARKVGYSSPFTFSTAFKRGYGVSPQAYRTGAPVVEAAPVGELRTVSNR